jgi:hypothetical protein
MARHPHNLNCVDMLTGDIIMSCLTYIPSFSVNYVLYVDFNMTAQKMQSYYFIGLSSLSSFFCNDFPVLMKMIILNCKLDELKFWNSPLLCQKWYIVTVCIFQTWISLRNSFKINSSKSDKQQTRHIQRI